MPTRRNLLLAGGAGIAAVGAWAVVGRGMGEAVAEDFPVSLSSEEWRNRLSEEAFAVLREHDTEPPFSSPLNDEERDGIYSCAGCGQQAYASATKFESGTGWPSFTQALDGAVGTQPDRSLLMLRTEVHCATCGGHFGHIFDDGPEPTGKRHCLNGVALDFAAA